MATELLGHKYLLNCLYLINKENCLVFLYLKKMFGQTRGTWDLSSPTRVHTHDPCKWKLAVLTTGPPGKSLFVVLFVWLVGWLVEDAMENY